MDENKIKPQLHVSMLDMLSKCGIQFQRRYGHRFGVSDDPEEIIKPGIALITGSVVHVTAEADLNNKISHGSLLSSEAISDACRSIFEAEWQGGVRLKTEENSNKKKTYGEAVDLTVSLSLLHHNEFAPDTKAIEVEKNFVIILQKYPIDLAGTIDIVEEDAIGDIKTMKANKSSVESLQMAMYANAYKIENDKYPSRVYHQKLIKTKTPKAILEETTPDDSWIRPLFYRIERFIQVIEAVRSGMQAFVPADTGHWMCTDDWCGYAKGRNGTKPCPFWSGR